MTQLASYLRRIGHDGPVEPTLACLRALHRRHALSIPYENLDVLMGRPLDFDLARIFDKVVTRQRGGWCYEVHILLEWALREIGFDASLIAAGIHRHERGDAVLGDHTAILVRLDQTYLADLGLGDGLREPIALVAGLHPQGALSFRLERLPDGYWRFQNHAFGYPLCFDFRDEPADPAQLAHHNLRQQTDPTATLVSSLVCQIMQPESVTCLTGRILRQKTAAGTTRRLIREDDFLPLLDRTFGLRDVGLAALWPKVAARHEQLFGDRTAEQIDYSGF